jgi:hypothetical protein
MCVTDLDLEVAEDEQATSPDPHPIGGRYAGVAWGLAERRDHHADADPAAAPGVADPAAAPATAQSR